MRITEKGQVTIPIEIREAYGFLPHTEVEFVRKGKDVVVRKALGKGKKKQTRGESLVAHLRSFEKYLIMDPNEVLKLTREG